MIVTNFATKEFQKGQDRLVHSLLGQRRLLFHGYQPGWPTHQESPYEFKVHAIKEALKIDPIVLWADASMILKGDINKIKAIIETDGYFMEEAGHYVGRWCNEHTRKYFNLNEGEMAQGPGGLTMFSAGLLGLNANSRLAMEFLSQWEKAARAGCFKGSWKDHRHDMTCGSIIAQRLNMKYQPGASHLCYVGPGYDKPHKDAVFHCAGLA